jgi:hypothetical protein
LAGIIDRHQRLLDDVAQGLLQVIPVMDAVPDQGRHDVVAEGPALAPAVHDGAVQHLDQPGPQGRILRPLDDLLQLVLEGVLVALEDAGRNLRPPFNDQQPLAEPQKHGVSTVVPGGLGRRVLLNPRPIRVTIRVRFCASGNPTNLIPVRTVQAALEITEYFLSHALRVYGSKEEKPIVQAAKYVVNEIRLRNLTDFTFNFWREKTKRFCGRDGEDLLAHTLVFLRERNYLSWTNFSVGDKRERRGQKIRAAAK